MLLLLLGARVRARPRTTSLQPSAPHCVGARLDVEPRCLRAQVASLARPPPPRVTHITRVARRRRHCERGGCVCWGCRASLPCLCLLGYGLRCVGGQARVQRAVDGWFPARRCASARQSGVRKRKKRSQLRPLVTLSFRSFFPHPPISPHSTMSSGKSEPPAAWKVIKPYLNGGMSGRVNERGSERAVLLPLAVSFQSRRLDPLPLPPALLSPPALSLPPSPAPPRPASSSPSTWSKCGSNWAPRAGR